MKTSNPHIPFATLADLAEEKLPAERDTVMAHVSNCPDCAAEFGKLTSLISLMRDDTSKDPPRDVLAYAVNIFQRRESKPSLLRRIAATLSFDSATSTPAFGMRSAPSASRQLLFAAEDKDLDLRITPRAREWVISGQVLGASCAGGEAKLEGADTLASAVLNELCEFNLEPVPPGNYTLRLRLQDVELEVSQLKLGV